MFLIYFIGLRKNMLAVFFEHNRRAKTFCFDIWFGERFNAVRFVLLQPRCKRNNSAVSSSIGKQNGMKVFLLEMIHFQ
jgi:hypothetical protein